MWDRGAQFVDARNEVSNLEWLQMEWVCIGSKDEHAAVGRHFP